MVTAAQTYLEKDIRTTTGLNRRDYSMSLSAFPHALVAPKPVVRQFRAKKMTSNRIESIGA